MSRGKVPWRTGDDCQIGRRVRVLRCGKARLNANEMPDAKQFFQRIVRECGGGRVGWIRVRHIQNLPIDENHRAAFEHPRVADIVKFLARPPMRRRHESLGNERPG